MITYYSVEEVADILRVEDYMVRWWIRTCRVLRATRVTNTDKPFDYVVSERDLKSFMNTTIYRDYINRDVAKPRVVKIEAIIELPGDEYYDEGLERIIHGIAKDNFIEDLW